MTAWTAHLATQADSKILTIRITVWLCVRKPIQVRLFIKKRMYVRGPSRRLIGAYPSLARSNTKVWQSLTDVEPLCHSELLFAMGYLQVSEGDTVKDSALGHSRARKVRHFSMECVCTLGNGR